MSEFKGDQELYFWGAGSGEAVVGPKTGGHYLFTFVVPADFTYLKSFSFTGKTESGPRDGAEIYFRLNVHDAKDETKVVKSIGVAATGGTKAARADFHYNPKGNDLIALSKDLKPNQKITVNREVLYDGWSLKNTIASVDAVYFHPHYVAHLAAHKKRLGDEVAKLAGDISKLQVEHKNNEAEVARIPAEISKLQADHKNKEGEVTRWGAELARAAAEVTRIQGELRMKDLEAAKLAGDISRLQSEHKTRESFAKLAVEITRLQAEYKNKEQELALLRAVPEC